MTGRIGRVFSGRKTPAFVGYVVAGDPDRETCIRAAQVLIDHGTDILELGVPFSDPVADGPVIQRADERALAAGTTIDTVFGIVREIREKTSVPIVLLVYCNMVWHRGIDRFCREAHEAGADGILVADMPVEESEEFFRAARRHTMDPIFLITRTTSENRIRKIAAKAHGFLYLVAVLGVTGVRDTVSTGAIDLLARVREHTPLPLALGFGISSPDHARQCADAGADAIIVGSAIVSIIEKNRDDAGAMERELGRFVSAMRAALNEGQSDSTPNP